MEPGSPTAGPLYGIDGPRRRPHPRSLPPEEELVAEARASYAAARRPDRLEARFDELREVLVAELRERIDAAVGMIETTFEAEIQALRPSTARRPSACGRRTPRSWRCGPPTPTSSSVSAAIDEIGRLCDFLEDELDACAPPPPPRDAAPLAHQHQEVVRVDGPAAVGVPLEVQVRAARVPRRPHVADHVALFDRAELSEPDRCALYVNPYSPITFTDRPPMLFEDSTATPSNVAMMGVPIAAAMSTPWWTCVPPSFEWWCMMPKLSEIACGPSSGHTPNGRSVEISSMICSARMLSSATS